jgi:hypothetical protein
MTAANLETDASAIQDKPKKSNKSEIDNQKKDSDQTWVPAEKSSSGRKLACLFFLIILTATVFGILIFLS